MIDLINSVPTPYKVLLTCLLFPIIAFGIYFSVYDSGFTGKVFSIVSSNPEFIVMVAFSAMVIAFNKVKFKKEYSTVEGITHGLAMVLAMLVMYMVFFTAGTGLKDDSIFNGRVVSATYMEPWTEIVTTTSCDSKGVCHTSTHHVRHSPEWSLRTSNSEDGNISISNNEYTNISRKFGNNVEVKLHHSNQTIASKALGEGDEWVTKANNILLPSSISHDVINYIKASKSTVLRKQFEETPAWVKKRLHPYQIVHSEGFGPIAFTHIIDSTGKVNEATIKDADKILDEALAKFGGVRKINVVVYLVDHETNRGFIKYLESAWGAFNKNDLIVVVALDEKGKPMWSENQAMTKHTLFGVEIEDKILRKSKNIQDVANIIANQIKIPSGRENGFLLTSMEEYSYLMGNIDIPLSYSIVGIFLASLFNLLLSFIMIRYVDT